MMMNIANQKEEEEEDKIITIIITYVVHCLPVCMCVIDTENAFRYEMRLANHLAKNKH